MGRRNVETDVVQHQEPPKKKNRSLSENLDLNTSIVIEEPLPLGEILVDVTQKQWRIGKPIGRGSFGEIYLASDDISKEANSQTSRYVIKIEPHSNGPLFVEIHCLIRSARHSKIKKWQNEKKMKLLGMPHYIANGSHVLGDTRYRFLVLPRYDCDVEKVINSSNLRLLQAKNILVLAVQIIDVLEYLHAQGYTHADIKSSNLMVGFDGSNFKTSKVNKNLHSNMLDKKIVQSKNLKTKMKYASYYYDEDFVLHNYLSSSSSTDYETEEEDHVEVLKSTRKSKVLRMLRNSKLKKSPLTPKNLRMRRLFNLRKIKSDVNYEDLNSSICSYDSYQELLENNNKNGFSTEYNNIDDGEVDHFKEAIQTQSSGHVYLLDFGLASKFINSDGSHKEYGMDQRKAHDGTLEYSSRDSHIGAHSRRSDLENLGYNILDWLSGNLPWKTQEMLSDPDLVHALKKNYMEDIKRLMEICFKTQSYPKFIEDFFEYFAKLDFAEKPDYKYCKSIFINEFVNRGYGKEDDMILNFNSNVSSTPRKKINYSKKLSNAPCKNTPPDILKRNAIVKVYGRENLHVNSWENDLKMNLIREGLSNDGIRKPCISRNFFVSDADLISKLRQALLLSHDATGKKFSPKNLRSTKRIIKKKKGGKNLKSNIGKFGNFLGSDKQYTWAEILAGNPERIIQREKCDNTIDNSKTNNSKKPRSRKVSNASDVSLSNAETNSSPNLLKSDFLTGLNPTYAMKEVVANYKRKALGKSALKSDDADLYVNENCYTPAMIKVMRVMEKRQKQEKILEEKETKKRHSKTDLNSPTVKATRSSLRGKTEPTPVNKKAILKKTIRKTSSAIKSTLKNNKKLQVKFANIPETNVQIETARKLRRRTIECDVVEMPKKKTPIIKSDVQVNIIRIENSEPIKKTTPPPKKASVVVAKHSKQNKRAPTRASRKQETVSKPTKKKEPRNEPRQICTRSKRVTT